MKKKRGTVPPALAKMRDWFDQKYNQGIENPVVKEPPAPLPQKEKKERRKKLETTPAKPTTLDTKPEIPVTKALWVCPRCKARKISTVTESTVAIRCPPCKKFVEVGKIVWPEGRPQCVSR